MCGFSFWMHPIILLFLASSSHHNTQILHTCAQNTLYTEVYPKGRFCEDAIPCRQTAHFHAGPSKSFIHTRKIFSILRSTQRDDSASTQSPIDKTHTFMLDPWNPSYICAKCCPYWSLPEVTSLRTRIPLLTKRTLSCWTLEILYTYAQNVHHADVYPKGRFCEHAIPSWQNAHFHARPFKSCIHTRKIVSTLRFTLRDDSANTQSPSDKTHAFMLEAWNPAYRPSKCSPYWGLP